MSKQLAAKPETDVTKLRTPMDISEQSTSNAQIKKFKIRSVFDKKVVQLKKNTKAERKQKYVTVNKEKGKIIVAEMNNKFCLFKTDDL